MESDFLIAIVNDAEVAIFLIFSWPFQFGSFQRLHDGFRVIGFIADWPDCDLQHLLFFLLRGIEVPDKTAVNLKLAKIVIGRYVTAACPAFVADAKIPNPKRGGMSIGCALFLCQGSHDADDLTAHEVAQIKVST